MIQIKEGLNELSGYLKAQSALTPRLAFELDQDLDKITKNFQEANQALIDKHFDFVNYVAPFTSKSSIALDSKIINFTQANRIKKWICDGYVSFRLIYRATQDGFKSTVFHEKCDKVKGTLTVVYSNINDKIFGGFIDD